MKKGVLHMKPDYKNWIPKGMLYSLIAGTVLSLALLLIFGVFVIFFGFRYTLGLPQAPAWPGILTMYKQAEAEQSNAKPRDCG